jgi:putative transposase
VRYRCLHRRRTLYPIRLMCRLLKVSSSGYYAHAESDGTYGSPRIHAQLRSEGLRCGRARVARLMREARLKGCPKRRFRVGSRPSATTVGNLLNQDFSAPEANRRWASDITYLWTTQGWLYLAVVMDLYSRRIVGWSMHRRIGRQVALAALDMALGQRQPTSELIHHSDRGPQYLSDEYQSLLRRQGITCSMSSAGSCYDNAVVESFFATLKRERTHRRHYRTRDDSNASTTVSVGIATSAISVPQSMRTGHNRPKRNRPHY